MVTVDRLIDNLVSHVEKNGGDSDAHHSLGIVHYLAFSRNASGLPAKIEGASVSFFLPSVMEKQSADDSWIAKYRSERSHALRVYHAESGLRNFETAIRLKPQNGLYWMNYAFLLEDVWRWKFARDPKQFPKEFAHINVPLVRETYSKAFALSKTLDANATKRNPSLVSFEAAKGLLRFEKASSAILSDSEKKELEEARATIERLEKLPYFPWPPPTPPICL